MKTVLAFVRSHPVSSYFLTTFAISWGGALLAIGGSGAMEGTTPGSDPRFVYALLAMLAGPSTAGILMTGLVHGRSGLRAFFSRLLVWRVSARSYVVALLTAPVAMVTTLLALSSADAAFRPGIVTSTDKGSLLVVSLAVGLSAGIFEELGWTGFAIPTLRRSRSRFMTGLLVGVVWSAWHLLPNIWASRAAAGELEASTYMIVTAVFVFVGYLTVFRVLMVWVYEQTSSLLLGMLMHASLTASLLALNPLGIAGTRLQIYSFALAAVLWLVVGVAAAWGAWTIPFRRLGAGRILTRPVRWPRG